MGSELDAVCPWCGQRYRDLRTDLTFAEVRQMLWVNSDDPKQWKHKRRNTVLGLWHQIKMGMWYNHLEMCEREYGDDVLPF